MTSDLKILTYNVLFPQVNNGQLSPYATKLGYSLLPNGQIEENSAQRFPKITKNLQKSDADIICLQEVTYVFYETIRAKLQGHYEFSELSLHGGSVSHGVAVIWKKTRLKCDCQSMGKVHQDRYKFRAFHSVDLIDLVVQKTLRVLSCHLYHPLEFDDPLHSISEVLDFARSNATDAVVVAGDLNSDVNYISKFRDLFSRFGYIPIDDQHPTEYQRSSSAFHPDSELIPTGKKLDWILWRTRSSDVQIEWLPLVLDFDLQASDHRPIGSCIRWFS